MDFDSIYQTYFKDIFLYLRSLTKNEVIAEEIAQDTFYKALKSIDKFDGRKDIKAWLFTIAKNTYFTYYNRQKIYIDSTDEGFLNTIPASESIFTDDIENEAQAFLIHQYLHDMPEPYKEVFSLRIFGELPFKKNCVIVWQEQWLGTSYILSSKKINYRIYGGFTK